MRRAAGVAALARRILWHIFRLGALLFALLLLIDPYDTGRFPAFGIVGIGDRTHADGAMPAVDATRSFNAAVIGNSTGQLLDPYRLSRETGLRFTQLTIAATGRRSSYCSCDG